MKSVVLTLSFLLLCLGVSAQSDHDQALVKKAISNYVEAFYQADTLLAYESVARELAKRGYYTSNGQIREATMSFDQLVALAKRWNATKNITAATPRKITVYEVLDKIASAKVEAQWGIDYFHLAKIQGRWMIINVLWQDYPPAK
ncbi:nuclear transport factor 2 family protein [Cesiribacter andamanensis]|uniref:Putative lumazine-binding protein n=1 Tax=Cesiribacter andamanensis AMV16 TaxID=1279009 RepID=M7NWE5_9BACT|nr:nuclear transport factor 2 family protein [Cesiribacter andamanensis]EMR02754.1 Putative lumazine-binding protein [Cesiribacter andamanensis AMV16]